MVGTARTPKGSAPAEVSSKKGSTICTLAVWAVLSNSAGITAVNVRGSTKLGEMTVCLAKALHSKASPAVRPIPAEGQRSGGSELEEGVHDRHAGGLGGAKQFRGNHGGECSGVHEHSPP